VIGDVFSCHPISSTRMDLDGVERTLKCRHIFTCLILRGGADLMTNRWRMKFGKANLRAIA
jgi:hypothetical protein